MATQRAGLASHDLTDFHIPIAPREPQREPVALSEPRTEDRTRRAARSSAPPAAAFPSLARGRREEMVSRTLRIPLSMAQALDELQHSSGVGLSEIVRDFIKSGLDVVEKGSTR